jgi:hypothetical protein
MVFLLSSTGVVVFKTHCSCTGDESVSVYVTPETCDENYHVHHTHSLNGVEVETNEILCHECAEHTNDCGCSDPDVKYVKLVNQLIDEEVKFVKINSNSLFLVVFSNSLLNLNSSDKNVEDAFYIDPPPTIKSSTDFLIQINQLKIPHIA